MSGIFQGCSIDTYYQEHVYRLVRSHYETLPQSFKSTFTPLLARAQADLIAIVLAEIDEVEVAAEGEGYQRPFPDFITDHIAELRKKLP